VRARELDENERQGVPDVLARIERAGAAVATECGMDVVVETDNRGRLPALIFRVRGFSPPRDAPTETGRDL